MLFISIRLYGTHYISYQIKMANINIYIFDTCIAKAKDYFVN